MSVRGAALALAVALAPFCQAARAASLPLWELGGGLAALRLPHYRGSDQSQTWVLPVPYAVYRGRILRADRDGARAMMFESDRFDLDISLSATAPTRSQDNRAREGMADLAATLEIGPNMNLSLVRGQHWELQWRSPLRAVLAVQRDPQVIGWTATPLFNLDIEHGPWRLGLQAGPVWGSQRLHAYYYDVDVAQAVPGRPAYQSSGGFGGTRGLLSLSRKSRDQWLGMFLRLDSVAGAVFNDSPLVRQQLSVACGIAWSWIGWRSDRLVEVDDSL